MWVVGKASVYEGQRQTLAPPACGFACALVDALIVSDHTVIENKPLINHAS